MANIILPGRWGSKPPLGTQINFGHPLANQIEACFLMNERGGLKLYDATGRHSTSVATAVGWSVDGTEFNGSSSTATITNNYFSGTDLSIVAVAKANAIGSGGSNNCIIDNTWGNNTQGFQMIIDPPTLIVWFGSTTISTDGGMSLGVFYTLAGTCRAGAQRYFVNAKEINTSAGTPNLAPPLTTRIGSAGGGGIGWMNGAIRFLGLWKRALTPTEIRWLQSEPYAFMLPPAPYRRWFLPPGMPGIINNPLSL